MGRASRLTASRLASYDPVAPARVNDIRFV